MNLSGSNSFCGLIYILSCCLNDVAVTPVSHFTVKWGSLIAPNISSTFPICVLSWRYIGALKYGI